MTPSGSLAEIKGYFYRRLSQYDVLERCCGVSEIAGEGDSLNRAPRVLRFLSTHTYYNGMQRRMIPDDPVKIMEFAFGQPFSHAINCCE